MKGFVMVYLKNESIYRDRYRILREIGEGGSSVVYMAVDTENDALVTIKKIKDNVFCNKDAALIIEDETRIIRELEHPAIPRVIEVYEDAFVLDYVPGNSLEKHIRKKGRLSEKEALKAAKELLEIFDYLHELKEPVIYRDLKPANVIIKPDGHVVLIDFGAARFYSEGSETDTLNLGTSGFAAPEQYGSLGQTDPRTDIYCFGKTLFQMMGGKCTPELKKIIEKCTRPDREDRFKNCREIKRALKKYPGIRFRNLAFRNLKLAVAAAVVALVVSFGYAHYDSVVSYAAVDAEARIPAVKERLGTAGVRIKEMLEEKNLWIFEK
ncbi:MAG: serine/threonine protein kinase [Butyrivibrio sp.]|nr:serine/threonine protein kinase [Butyrivibrio sp.]